MSGESGDVVRRERFSGGPARGFLSSMAADERIFEADLAVDRAHVVMLAEQGIVPEEEAGEILATLSEVEATGHDALPDGEDVHAAIETAVIDSIGPVGGKMHTARSRNDEVATCIRHRLREDLLEVLEATVAFREALVGAAEGQTETLLPGYTHLQPAQPTTVAHWLLSYEGAVARDTERLLDAYSRTNRCPLGAAAFAGTPFDIDRERTAELLGFESVLENSMDASSTRDFLLETVSALATLSTTLSGMAEDLILFSNKGYVELSDEYSSTSSIMPQKKNPDTLELVRATAGDASSGLNGLLTTLKGLPRAYNRDLQRATPHAWETVDAVREATDVAAGAVATAEWNEHQLEAAAGEGFSTATGVADALAMAGLPFRTAHELVALASEDASDYAALDAASEAVLGDPLAEYVPREAVEAALDPEASVASRDSQGGPAPEAVEETLAAAWDGIGADERAVDDLAEALGAAATALDEEVRSYE
ncbi:argininosuccinate lyase [Halalkalicoccus jeotgali B3]|uniref:Argininosuccinate lyase n=2 Tax=Halalkalicoccus jeotgali (strain DSM 18796 / CECT 7217 / JCM 14584 / KCTC 4019 / B3) TaxID=795797 RepID=D8J512_HALJB|nr:argininosuccinate lyase [Halalkalicoccus jeotgali]ADJ13593.1 argininosuccinate lyase [Halalkalicoccus jeotgali B3]